MVGDLVKRFNAGDAEAFAELYRRHFAAVRAYHFLLLHREEVAENLAQETFIRVFQAAPRLPEGHFRPWLFMIARNLAIDEARRSRRRLEVPFEAVEAVLPAGEACDPSARVLQGEERLQIMTVLRTLPRHYQEIILLRDLFGFSYDEIGRTMNLSREAVKSVLHRARTEFRRRHADMGGEH